MEDVIAEAVREQVAIRLHAVASNLSRLFGGAMYQIKLEMEQKGDVDVISRLIDQVITTTDFGGPDGEQFPVWAGVRRSECDPEVLEAKKLMRVLREALESHGVKSVPGFGD